MNHDKHGNQRSIIDRGVVGTGRLNPMAAVLLTFAVASAGGLVPRTAVAQNECVVVGQAPADNGTAADSYDCDQAAYAEGVRYDAEGDLTVDFSRSGTVNVNEAGVRLSATGDDSISLSAAARLSGTGSSADATLDVLTEAGDIFLDLDRGALAASAGDNDAVRVRATGGGNISINHTGTSVLTGIQSSAGEVGLRAIASGGNGNINATVAGVIGGNHGIEMRTAGTGTIGLTVTNRVSEGQLGIRSEDDAAIDLQTETGDLQLVLTAAASAESRDGLSIRTTTSGNALIRLERGAGAVTAGGFEMENGGPARIELNALGGLTRLENDGEILGAGFLVEAYDELAVTGTGAGLIEVDNTHLILGRVDFSGNTGGVEMRVTDSSDVDGSRIRMSGWRTIGNNRFSAGDDALHIATNGYVATSAGFGVRLIDRDLVETEMDFLTGQNSLVNEGLFAVGIGTTCGGAKCENKATEVRLINLDSFDNSGVILLGADLVGGIGPDSEPTGGTDGIADDVLIMQNTQFNGLSGSRIGFDVLLTGGRGQADCQTRDANFDLAAADCVDLRGATTSGQTLVTVNDVFGGDPGAVPGDGIVLIDVGGGTSAPEHFVLDPNSEFYSSRFGGVLDKGLLIYPLVYDADTQQHKLVSIPGVSAQRFPLLGQAANELWRTSADAWFERQTDERTQGVGEGDGGGLWFRAAGGSAERDSTSNYQRGSGEYAFDNGFEQDNYTVTMGLDAVSRESGDRVWMLGGMVGYARARLAFDDLADTANLEGLTAGAYGSYMVGRAFVDGVLNAAWLDMENDAPALSLSNDSVLDGKVASYGGRIEAGWRLLEGAFELEPIVGVSYVRSNFDTFEVPASDSIRDGNPVTFDSPPESLRAGLGARMALPELMVTTAPTRLFLTARIMEELEGRSAVSIANAGPDLVADSVFDGSFGEVDAGISVSNVRRTAVGYLNLDTIFNENYASVGVSAGFRFQW